MSTGGQLKYTLVVRHPETDAPVALIAGQSVPQWATDLVHKDNLEAASGKSPEVVVTDKADSPQAAPAAKKATAKKTAAKKAAPAKKTAAPAAAPAAADASSS